MTPEQRKRCADALVDSWGEPPYSDIEAVQRQDAERQVRTLEPVIDEMLSKVRRSKADPYDNHDRRILEDARSGKVTDDIAVVECPHRIGLSYYGKPAPSMDEWLMRLPCQCNDASKIVGRVHLEPRTWDGLNSAGAPDGAA